ncbi:MAG: type I secretion system permease/ATPase [Siculibacillus sp.]|nr:type I secretion system permease/ATPase [Siculibacillus sp.]
MKAGRDKVADAPDGELRAALRQCRSGFLGVAVASFVINLLTLTGAIYMLQVYDRVIPSRSTATLVGLTGLLIFLYAAYAFFDVVRAQLLMRIGARLSRLLGERAFALHAAIPLHTARSDRAPQPLHDLDQIRAFVSGLGPTALFDLPWLPFFLVVIALTHPLLGLVAVLGAGVIVTLTILTEVRSREPIAAATAAGQKRHFLAEAARRNAEVIRALGMRARVTDGWNRASRAYFEEQEKVSAVSGTLGSVSKVLRMLLQSLMLGMGAWLVIRQEATAGIMIAASILVSRALAPVEVAIANWRGFITARQSWARLRRLLAGMPPRSFAVSLPVPRQKLEVQGLFVAAPGDRRPIVQDISFTLEAGAGLGVIGPSAAGKTTLLRALTGVWAPLRGSVRLDGFPIEQWDPDALGAAIGYLPQDVELFDGSIAANIARFRDEPDAASVIAAARAAGIQEMIAGLPDGYSTLIGEGGCALSAGQRQRIGLARALYGDPFLLVLDEPGSNLDNEGEEALIGAIRGVRARGGIVVIVAHRPGALAAVDTVMVLVAGRRNAFGPRDEVLRNVVRERPRAAEPAPRAPAVRDHAARAPAEQAPTETVR